MVLSKLINKFTILKTKKNKHKTSKTKKQLTSSSSSNIKHKSNPTLNTLVTNTFITDIGNCKVYFKTYNAHKINDTMQYKIVSVSYFLLSTNEPITSDNKYLKGVKNIIKSVCKLLPDYKVRIYCDEHAFQLLENDYSNPKVEFFIYKIPQLLEKGKYDNKQYHKGYMGTFMRFLPFFNYKYHNVDIVINVDIDNNINNAYLSIIKNEVPRHGFYYKYRACYSANPRMIKLGYVKYPIIASFISMNKSMLTLPNTILNNFFNTHILKDDARYMTYLMTLSIPELFKKGYHKEHNTELNKYMYGVDEYMLNYNLFNWFKANNITIGCFDLFYTINMCINIFIDIISRLVTINSIYSNKKVIELFIYLQSLMYNLGFRYNDRLTVDNYKSKLSEFKVYIETVNYQTYYYRYIYKNNKRNAQYKNTVNSVLKFLKTNKHILELKTQEYECIAYNLEIYKSKYLPYHSRIFKVNDSNYMPYTIKQYETNTAYTLY
jgi:hypothetical protein